MIRQVQEFINNKKPHIMKRNFKRIIYSIAIILLVNIHLNAQDLIYTPKNPAFGGNTFNYQWMLSSAQAQDTYKMKTDNLSSPYDYYKSDPAKDFAESLNRQILSQLSRQIVSKQFGEDALSEGSYLIGDYQIDIGNKENGINITIVDVKTGAATTVSVPYF